MLTTFRHLRICFRHKGNLRWQESRHPHIDHHAPVGFRPNADAPFHGLKVHTITSRIACFKGKTADTASTIAALFHLTTRVIEDPIAKRLALMFGRFQQQHLISTDAKATVSQSANQLRRRVDGLADAIENNKVVPRPLHFRKF
ncbi:unknown [Sutterella wadsworthensis CAG:135]|nr:unknown [Sutterella wadsworthensis CAG:135]